MSETVWIILAGAAVTYLTRIGGHLALSRLERVPARLEAALDAVPAAVLTTLVAPALMTAGPVEFCAIAVAGAVALRAGIMAMFFAGAAVLMVGRWWMG
ncbi:MAG: branched-chain amino acid transport [Ancylobacter novellus]|uniref:Branched-chain amino acid transport n=1 Tax=Ancylobacter novellus TaxID=921 RepID=A0A2W5K6C2_ANCNO|nr:MAG: branched-chain amino acid transport [Ancylobacter novellus]